MEMPEAPIHISNIKSRLAIAFNTNHHLPFSCPMSIISFYTKIRYIETYKIGQNVAKYNIFA